MHLCALEGRLGLGLFARSGVRFVLTLWCGLIPLPAVFNCVRAMKQFGWQGHGLDPEQHQAHTNWSNYGKMGRDSGCSVASVEGPIWSGVTNRFDHRKGRRRIVSPCSRQWMNERCTHTYLIIFIYYARWCTYIYIYIYMYQWSLIGGPWRRNFTAHMQHASSDCVSSWTELGTPSGVLSTCGASIKYECGAARPPKTSASIICQIFYQKTTGLDKSSLAGNS